MKRHQKKFGSKLCNSDKNGLLQLVQDYWKLNQFTIKNKIPLPLIGKVINKLKKTRYFNKLDLIQGYNNV